MTFKRLFWTPSTSITDRPGVSMRKTGRQTPKQQNRSLPKSLKINKLIPRRERCEEWNEKLRKLILLFTAFASRNFLIISPLYGNSDCSESVKPPYRQPFSFSLHSIGPLILPATLMISLSFHGRKRKKGSSISVRSPKSKVQSQKAA